MQRGDNGGIVLHGHSIHNHAFRRGDSEWSRMMSLGLCNREEFKMGRSLSQIETTLKNSLKGTVKPTFMKCWTIPPACVWSANLIQKSIWGSTINFTLEWFTIIIVEWLKMIHSEKTSPQNWQKGSNFSELKVWPEGNGTREQRLWLSFSWSWC